MTRSIAWSGAPATGGRYTYTNTGEIDSVDYWGTGVVDPSIDALGRVDTLNPWNAGLTDYTSTPDGRVDLITRPNGASSDYGYDVVQRITDIHHSRAGTTLDRFRVTLNSYGNRTAVSQIVGGAVLTSTYRYDKLGRIQQVSAPQTGTVGYGYNARGQRTALTYPDGTQIDYTYLLDGTLDQVRQGSTTLADYAYESATGRLASVTRSNGALTSYSYDQADRLTDLHTTVSSSTRSRFTYTLDRLGLRMAVSENLNGNSRTIAYSYDGLLRLTEADASVGSDYAYSYDLAGNRTSVTADGNTTTQSYSAIDQVIGWNYDAAGNLLSDGINTLTYDALGRLTSRNGTGYSYNGDGTLVAATTSGTTTRYTQDLAAPLSQVLMIDSAVAVYGRERLFTVSPLGLSWGAHDGLGSLRQTLDGSGANSNTTSYDPWGVPAGSAISAFGFAGELQQDEQVYLRARWYNAASGTLLGRDPFAGFAEQPYSQHYFQYAYSNPGLYTDPSGRCVPYLDRDCRPIWETGQDLNWEDAGKYWSTVGNTVKDAVVEPVRLLYAVATQEEARAQVARGAQALVADLPGSAGIILAAAATPFTDIYQGIVCGDSTQIGRGLTGFGLILGGARLARYSGSAVNGRTDFLAQVGRRGGILYGEQKLAMLRNYLNRRGVDLLVGDEYLPSAKAGGFDYMSPRSTLRLRSNPTQYEVWHELSHYIQYRRIGPEAYRNLSRTAQWNAAEQFVFDTLNRTRRWNKLNEAEQMHASQYIEDVGGFR